jgi:hypothetical protein
MWVAVGRAVVVIGSGTVAAGICAAIAASPIPVDRVIVLGSSLPRTSALCAESNLTAGAARSSTTFVPGSHCSLDDTERLRELFDIVSPLAVVVASSLHSPRALWGAVDRWADLLDHARFGITVALQAINALYVARALMRASSAPTVINLCYPDVVNPLLSELFQSPCWGAGNVMTVEASWRSELALSADADLALVGTHAALRDSSFVRGFLRLEEIDSPLDGPIGSLPPSAHRASLGVQVRMLLWSLVTSAELNVSMPGAGALPGGRPVKIADQSLTFRPAGTMSEAETTDFISAGLAADGISSVTSEGVRFCAGTRDVLESYELLRPFAEGFSLREIEAAAVAFSAMRVTLQSNAVDDFDSGPPRID